MGRKRVCPTWRGKERVVHVIWPDVFTNPDFAYPDATPRTQMLALAQGYLGWGLCMSGNHPPANFGEGMMKIGVLLDCSVSPDGLVAVEERVKADYRRFAEASPDLAKEGVQDV